MYKVYNDGNNQKETRSSILTLRVSEKNASVRQLITSNGFRNYSSKILVYFGLNVASEVISENLIFKNSWGSRPPKLVRTYTYTHTSSQWLCQSKIATSDPVTVCVWVYVHVHVSVLA